MASPSIAEMDPVPSLDDHDESVRIAVKALGDMRNSRPQPSSSIPIRVYNLPPSSSRTSFPRLLTTFARVPLLTARPRATIFDLSDTTNRLDRRCQLCRFRRSCINNTSRKHRFASLRANKSELKSRQGTVFSSLRPPSSPPRSISISRLRLVWR